MVKVEVKWKKMINELDLHDCLTFFFCNNSRRYIK